LAAFLYYAPIGLAETYRQISLSYRLHKPSLLSVIAVLVPEQAFAVLAPSDPFPLAVVYGQNTRITVETIEFMHN